MEESSSSIKWNETNRLSLTNSDREGFLGEPCDEKRDSRSWRLQVADSVIAEYFKDSKPEVIPLKGFNEKLKRRQELMMIIEKMETEKKQICRWVFRDFHWYIQQELKLYLGEMEQAENEQFLVSWRSVKSNRLDERRLKEERLEIYEKYKKLITSRRFSIKVA